jgi:steroid delta-isomerase-like uncharacterized protein
VSSADVEAVARSYFDELTNKRNLAYVDQLFDSNIKFYDPAILPDGKAEGLAEVKQFFGIFFKAFPDLHFAINDLLIDGDRAAIRFTWTGTFKKKLLGIRVAEHHVSVPGIDIFHIANGKITEVRVAFDRLELMQQLGGITNPL